MAYISLLSNIGENLEARLRTSLYRGVEIVKFSTCPGTSKWP